MKYFTSLEEANAYLDEQRIKKHNKYIRYRLRDPERARRLQREYYYRKKARREVVPSPPDED
ncbi:hypothetical protein EON65_17380 [archaeon]|nr:MAG: hypothetical protein EON65_17380 [archaeon]